MADNLDPTIQDPDNSDNGSADELAKLKAAIADERKKQRDLTKQLSEAKEAAKQYEGLDVEEFRRLKQLESDKQQKDLEAKGEYDKSLQAQKDKLAEAEAKQTAAEQRANRATIERHLVLAFGRANGDPAYLDHFLRMNVDGLAIDGDKVTFPTTLRADGTEIDSLGDYVTHIRDNGGMGLYFKPLNNAAGSNDLGGKAPAPKVPAVVTVAQIGSNIDAIAAGTVTVGE